MPTRNAKATAVVAEKPSVARDIANVLGARQRGKGFLHGNGYVVTWAVGHLVALAQPHEIRPEWKPWRRDRLPMLPEHWPLVVYDQTRDQYEIVRRILNSPKIASVICATDAGREGELIFRYIYDAAGSKKPVQRLWISSLTPEAIRQGLRSLRPSSKYAPLADAARARSRADLAGWDEPLARLQSRLRPGPLGGPRADTDAGHGCRARVGGTELRPRGLYRGRRQVRPAGEAGCRARLCRKLRRTSASGRGPGSERR